MKTDRKKKETEGKSCDNCANLDHVTYQEDEKKSEACYVMAFHAVPETRICDEWEAKMNQAKTCNNCRHREVIKEGTPDETEVCQYIHKASTIYGESFHLIPMEGTCQDWKGHDLPIPTTGANVNSLIDWLRGALAEKENGEIGLIFTVHCARVRKWQKIDVTNAIDKNGSEY